MNPKSKGTCFVISPIGELGSDERKRADQILNHIIEPACSHCGYDAVRADKISEPGIITSQVVDHLLEDPMVLADLTGRNPNVFYELAIRHAVRKPVVQIIQEGEPIPFDVAITRTIQVNHRDLDSAARCKEEIIRQIQAVEKDPGLVDTPISTAIDVKSLRESGKPVEKSLADIFSMLQDVRSRLSDLEKASRLSAYPHQLSGGTAVSATDLLTSSAPFASAPFGSAPFASEPFVIRDHVRCKNCGAPIDIPSSARPLEVKCSKCGRSELLR